MASPLITQINFIKFIAFFVAIWGPSTANQLNWSMNKCSVSKKPHFICNRLIISKVYCFDVKASWWGCFKGVSLLSHLCLAGNVDDLFDTVTGLVVFNFFPESDEWSDDDSNKSSKDDEDEESDEISIQFCAIRTSSCSLIASLWRNMSSNSYLASFIISITSEARE